MSEYRIVVIRHQLRMVLAHPTLGCYRLPRVAIGAWNRPAQHLILTVARTYGVNVTVVEILVARRSATPCAVVELRDGQHLVGFQEVGLDQVDPHDLSGAEREQLRLILESRSDSPLAYTGWIEDAAVWVESTTHDRISRRARDIEQVNAGCGHALVRFRSIHGKHYWLKATGAPNVHEFSITRCLSKTCCTSLPDCLAFDERWNAWLMSENGFPLLTLPRDSRSFASSLEAAITEMARMQLLLVGREAELLNAGAFDQRLEGVAASSAELFECVSETMGREVSPTTARIDRGRVASLHRLFHTICRKMNDLALPNTINHGDLSLSNILKTPDGAQFIDWCEAYVGHPLSSVQHLLLLNNAESPGARAAIDRRLKDEYRKIMQSACDPARLERGFIYMPFLSAVSALYGRGSWFKTSQRREPHRQSFVRTIARYLDRAANDPQLFDALAKS